jgi:hypothetical protein
MTDLVDKSGFVGAEAAPSGPEFEEDDFAFDGVIGEFFASGGDGVEVGGRLLVLGSGEGAETREEQDAGKCRAQKIGWRPH